jgi:acyl-CoA hydrolase
MLTEAAAIAIALIAARLAAQPADGNLTFGWKRVEILSAQANGITLWLLAAWFVYEAIRRLIHPPQVAGGLVLDRTTVTLRFLAAPTDAGYSGYVSGGRVLEWIDKAGYACAGAWSGRYSVTAYVGNISFTRPVQVGDMVEVTARIVQTGRSSINILVSVRSGTIAAPALERSTECLMIFVAMDADGRPTPVPTWIPVADDDHRRQEAALQLRKVRADIEEAMAGQRYTEAGTAPSVVLRFLAAPAGLRSPHGQGVWTPSPTYRRGPLSWPGYRQNTGACGT